MFKHEFCQGKQAAIDIKIKNKKKTADKKIRHGKHCIYGAVVNWKKSYQDQYIHKNLQQCWRSEQNHHHLQAWQGQNQQCKVQTQGQLGYY